MTFRLLTALTAGTLIALLSALSGPPLKRPAELYRPAPIQTDSPESLPETALRLVLPHRLG